MLSDVVISSLLSLDFGKVFLYFSPTYTVPFVLNFFDQGGRACRGFCCLLEMRKLDLLPYLPIPQDIGKQFFCPYSTSTSRC